MAQHALAARASRVAVSPAAIVTALFCLVGLTGCPAGPAVQDHDGSADVARDSVPSDAIADAADTVIRPDARDVVTDRGPVVCTNDQDCADSPDGQYCDIASGGCHLCLPSPNTCTGGDYCDPTFHCVAGCARDEDCAGNGDGGVSDGGASRLRCDTGSHACVQCLGDLDCPTDLVCATSSHTCVMGCSASRPCPTGQDCCGNMCLDLLNDNAHCGSCGHACGASETCCGGICYDLGADPRHCGTCSNRCSVTNGVAGCAAGQCTVDRCFPGYGDCDTNPANGCESPTSSDPQHCGSCANVCASGPHASASCTSGVCSSGCDPGFLDCNGGNDGCEVDLNNDAVNCGACGRVCTGANATGGCTNGVCVVASCTPGFADCDRRGDNGCEVDVRADPLNCGGCFQYCTSGANSTSSCVNSGCVVSCSAGFGNCNAMASDGCESNFSVDPLHCGSCTNTCPTPNNATATCASATCGFICQPGFQNCNGMAGDGCEVNVRADALNCGSCNTRCSAPNGTPTCRAGSCAVGACNTGFSDCDGDPMNGCEVNSSTDSSNCGGCGTICTGGQVCQNGTCSLLNPFPSTGAEGAFAPSSNTVLPAGVHNYTTINIPAGVTVTVSGNGLLDLRATGNVTIAGTIDLTGGVGGNGVRPTGGGGGGATAIQQTAGVNAGGTGGSAPAGGAATGCGANGAGGNFGGGSGQIGALSVGGGGGGGPGGGGGGLIGSGCNGGTGGGGATAGAGGQSGGPPYDGAPGQTGSDACGSLLSGGGGGSIGNAAAMDLAMSTTFGVGSGGGGGSARYFSGLSGAEGGGGGGGGAIRISSPTQITITSTGRIVTNGGAGGNGNDANATCTLNDGGSGGGGGSGGAIYLASPTLTVAGTLSAIGGAAGHHGANATGGDGGAGGLGRIRLSTTTAMCSLTGTFNPPLRSGCAATTTAGNVYIGQYPR